MMTLRQKFLKFLYPLFVALRKKGGDRSALTPAAPAAPAASFYDLQVQLNNGKTLRFDSLRGRKVLLVNTASDCGFTPQYAELQQLYGSRRGDLEIIGFPANDFKEQEKGSDEQIERFCQVNFGVTFPLAKKSRVVKGAEQHPVYQWLTQPGLNGWNERPPEWNFAKYLVDEEGRLTHYFPPATSPVGREVAEAVQANP